MNRCLALGLTTGALLTLSLPRPADACGGFFCSQVPVLQTAERVVFEMEGDVVTAYIQLQYEGSDPNFAWIVPVPDVPEIEVGVGQAMFDALEDQTKPVFIGAPAPAVAADIELSSCGGGFGGPPALQVRSLPVPEVDVWQEQTVGPFDSVIVSAERAEDLNDWLRVNGYRVEAGSEAIVQAYLDEGMKLLALKLSQDAVASQVEPIKLTYRDSRGCASIPIKLTAIAAIPGLEIVTYVFGSGRAKSVNFGAVDVDPGTLLSARDYRPAMAAAVDLQAEGRGFVTEFAQPTLRLSDRGSEALQGLLSRHGWVTRLRTELDPAEMTADPMFEIDATLPEVSNQIQLGGNFDVQSGSMFLLLAGGLLVARRFRR